MKKAQYTQRGPVPQDVIDAVEFQTPPLSAGQVLIEVLAAPINPSDVLTLTGEYGLLPPLPAVGGNEGVGRIAELGPEVTQLKVGQTVLLPIQGGSWATHMVGTAKHLIALPGGADPKQLAMITINPPTALLMLSEFVDLQPGDWVIQNAANSAVGTYLIQIAKSRGLRTINVVRRESAVEAVRAAGADVVLVDGDDLGKRAREAADKAPIKLGIDAVGGISTQHIAQSLGEGGIVVNYGAMSGEACSISPASFVFRDVSLRGFWLSRWFQQASPARRTEVFGEIAQRVASGQLQARVQATYGLDQIKEAVAAAAAGERDGKILILPNGPV
ncbi:zinc-dependent alcohol dehydrogenase family protein [Lysobacter capsici]|uniref:zinc-dependent alcohol dehydrogenase family protein n=1 Tax=Lysobacter capsici TaxID=435897 RepID=UPI001C006500|nr:zinc-dependent alcohol dehydrogenase family protein [Lysobacter capsici]QWF15652.1 zinc-dependent alcohol dehydrogenase family protein [Lysobacter capsici]